MSQAHALDLTAALPPRGLEAHGISNARITFWNPTPAVLYEEAIRRREGRLSHSGALVVSTGEYTGRSPNDKFIVKEPSSDHQIDWGLVNRPFSLERYNALRVHMLSYLHAKDLFIQDCKLGAQRRHQLPIRVITELAWHSLFARNMFIQDDAPAVGGSQEPAFTLIDAPGFRAIPDQDGTRSEMFVIVNFARHEVLIGGTEYAGELKKAMFTVMNYLLPLQGVLPLHSAANHGKDEGDVALFLGLSGTGKTTLSADPERALIGDDEHGWSDEGVFNFEGGCYAKAIRLSEAAEPAIYQTTRRFGTVLENVVLGEDRQLDLDSAELSENSRACYPISHIDRASRSGIAGHPKVMMLLTADAFGVLPPLARLTPAQAVYHFLSGYTAKVAGTERGVEQPQATFSACFGAPFMAMPPIAYAKLLGKRLAQHGTAVWLVNTGWTGGTAGVGKRIALAHTRAMVRAVLRNELDQGQFRRDSVFGFEVPTRCPGVPDGLLDVRGTWPDRSAYDNQAAELASLFVSNFAQFGAEASAEVRAARPSALR